MDLSVKFPPVPPSPSSLEPLLDGPPIHHCCSTASTLHDSLPESSAHPSTLVLFPFWFFTFFSVFPPHSTVIDTTIYYFPMYLEISPIASFKAKFEKSWRATFKFLFLFWVFVGIEYGSKFYRCWSFKVFNLSQPHVLSLLYQLALLVLYCS